MELAATQSEKRKLFLVKKIIHNVFRDRQNTSKSTTYKIVMCGKCIK